jgi:hypothetical protein
MLMAFQSPMKLALVTAIHNIFLCVLSLGMFVAAAISIYERYSMYGVDELFCSVSPSSNRGLLAWTMYIYYLSKFPELFDTVILVLKKVSLLTRNQ